MGKNFIHGYVLALNYLTTQHLHKIAVTWFRLDSLETVLNFQEIAGINKGVKLDNKLGTNYFYYEYFVLRHSRVLVYIP